MRTLNLFATSLLAALCLMALTAQGCSKAADRTLTIFQLQSSKTHAGAFDLNTSGLPTDAIELRSETGEVGSPLTTLHLNMDYEFEIVLRIKPRSDEDGVRKVDKISTNE